MGRGLGTVPRGIGAVMEAVLGVSGGESGAMTKGKPRGGGWRWSLKSLERGCISEGGLVGEVSRWRDERGMFGDGERWR